jgi:hypothetical protein
MLKAILMVLLTVVTTSADARDWVWTWDKHEPKKQSVVVVYPDAGVGWVKVASKPTYNMYISPASIRKVGNNVEMLHLYELQLLDQVAGKSFRSVKAKAAYNCNNQQSRILTAAAYSGSMGKEVDIKQPSINKDSNYVTVEGNRGKSSAGIVNEIFEPGKWKPVTPGSTEEILWNFACGT